MIRGAHEVCGWVWLSYIAVFHPTEFKLNPFCRGLTHLQEENMHTMTINHHIRSSIAHAN